MPPSLVTQSPAASSADALTHFARRLSPETDCADEHGAMAEAGGGLPDFVLLDVRGPRAYARSHVPGAISLPHKEITAERIANWPDGTLFRPVKLMLSGMIGWADEGFPFFATGEVPGSVLDAGVPVTDAA